MTQEEMNAQAKADRAKASKENGKKGGRPKSTATLEAQVFRDLLIKTIEKEKLPLITVLIEKSKRGDLNAMKLLLERAYGKPNQSVDMDHSGGFKIELINYEHLTDSTPVQTEELPAGDTEQQSKE